MLEKHTCKLIRKLCTAGTAVLENIAVKNRKKHSYNKVSYNYPGSLIQADHNSRRLQYSNVLFVLFSCFGWRKFEKTLVTSNV